MLRKIIRTLTAPDSVAAVFATVLALLALVFSDRVDWQGVLKNVGIIYAAIFIATAIRANVDAKWSRILHAFYIIPVVVFIFKTVEKLSFSIHGRDYDNLLIAADKLIFGVNPTQWLYENITLSPLSVEVLQICYFSYYLFFATIMYELFLRRKHHTDGGTHDNELEEFVFTVIFGFFLSYIGYMMLPAIGPRFTLHDFVSLSHELPGLWLTDTMRDFINRGENVTTAMTSAEAIQVVTRDAFPSGHTELTLVAMILALRYRIRSRWVVFAFGVGLILATVLLRYHYVIDLLAGSVLAMVVLYISTPVQRFFQRLTRL